MWSPPGEPVPAIRHGRLRSIAFTQMDPLAFPGQMSDWSTVYLVTRSEMRQQVGDSAVTIWLGVGRPNYVIVQFGVMRIHDSSTQLALIIPDFPMPSYSQLVPRTLRKQS